MGADWQLPNILNAFSFAESAQKISITLVMILDSAIKEIVMSRLKASKPSFFHVRGSWREREVWK